jgi:putative nucleotide binding protein
MGMEEYAIVLDYRPHGHPEDSRPIYKREPIAYAIGEDYLTLIELVPKKGVELKPHERVYIGKEGRDKIDYIKRRITANELTAAARSELPYAVETIVSKNEKKFVKFFNEAGPVSTRLHMLELLPGIGKKLMWEILDERKKKPFESFEDISKRIKALPDPKKLIIKRIVSELEEEGMRVGKGKYKLFVSPPPRKEKPATPS